MFVGGKPPIMTSLTSADNQYFIQPKISRVDFSGNVEYDSCQEEKDSLAFLILALY